MAEKRKKTYQMHVRFEKGIADKLKELAKKYRWSQNTTIEWLIEKEPL